MDKVQRLVDVYEVCNISDRLCAGWAGARFRVHGVSLYCTVHIVSICGDGMVLETVRESDVADEFGFTRNKIVQTVAGGGGGNETG